MERAGVNQEEREFQRQLAKDPTRIANSISIPPPVYVTYHSSYRGRRHRRGGGWRPSDPRQIPGASTGAHPSGKHSYASTQIMTGLSKANFVPRKYRTPMERIQEAVTAGVLAAARQQRAAAAGAGAAAVAGGGQPAGPGAGVMAP